MATCPSSFAVPVDPGTALPCVTLAALASALEASWDSRTAYRGVWEAGNPALGQCYPTARAVQSYFPHFDIASGEVDTGSSLEWHFWNIDPTTRPAVHLDLTWQQFAPGSKVNHFAILDRHSLGDSPPTIERCRLLLDRVLIRLGRSFSWPAGL